MFWYVVGFVWAVAGATSWDFCCVVHGGMHWRQNLPILPAHLILGPLAWIVVLML